MDHRGQFLLSLKGRECRVMTLESACHTARHGSKYEYHGASCISPNKAVLPTLSMKSHAHKLAFAACLTLAAATLAFADETPMPKVVAPHEDKTEKLPADLSGHKRVGKASFYAKRFAGHKMANGAPMQPQGNNAASKTLPLGTTAKVTNVETGASAVVKIEDRGPYVKGRIVDLSPSTARKIGVDSKEGVAKVSVEPIAVPLPNGDVKPGVAAHDPANH
jgi:rare lipoprotein A